MGTVGVHTHRDPPAPRGEDAGPPPPPPQNGRPSAWIVVGPRTRAQLARVLEQRMGAVWLALLETSGVPEGQPWRLVVSEAHLEPAPPS